MKRRTFIAGLGGAAAWPVVARGQQTALPVVGFLHQGAREANERFLAEFRQGLRENGFVESQNVAIEFRWAEGHYDQLETLVADLVRRQVTVILAAYRPAAIAAKSATSRIPIVFASGSDPVQSGLVTSLNHPGGNITGVYLMSGSIMAAKRLELMRELVPKLQLVAVLLNPTNNNFTDNVKELQGAAQELGQQIELLKVSSSNDLESGLARVAELHAGALFVSPDTFLQDHRDHLITWAARHNVPAMYYDRTFVDDGGLLGYTPDDDGFRWSGIYVGRILRGQNPADLPIMQPTKIELLINLKTAKALNLEIPPQLLARATEVIE
jgi:putative tryptophan/tyrosine transport system substrate-binding protein